ncbi:MltA domain-containing protein [Microcoleus sp. FACHB-68]|uniref:murein transglycosylase A n=1 Tax=Microcoleus sp. FACHB-68 TaxID=2692826 RepID=UPI00168842CF|nr:MltA domain-containing protein [Microcoleus sp. FACHB-68]MBD1939701.1 MltA domain-containing protein [Microcoleus sp. FACHB-68]
MIKKLALVLSLGVALSTLPLSVLSSVPLQPIIPDRQNTSNVLGLDDQLWDKAGQPGDRQALLTAIDNSLRYLETPAAAKAYQQYPAEDITLDRVRRSLQRFRQLVIKSNSPAELQAAVRREFVYYQSTGSDDRGTVFFTGYYTPQFAASRVPNSVYRYPLYRRPPNFANWSQPHPTRAQLEGYDGLQAANGPLRGMELVWLSDRLEAFWVHIQGSAQLQLTDGSVMSVGYGGATNYPYTSIGRLLANDGKLKLDGQTIPVLTDFFRRNPAEMNNYLPRNNRFIFFAETKAGGPTGSLQVPVTAERSIATDKSVMPPGALALVHTKLPYHNAAGQIEQRLVSRYVLDQDAGSAIKGPGRADYFVGAGKMAGERAGVTGTRGNLYYLLLK